MSGFPGDPTVGQIAAGEQRAAQAREAVQRLLERVPASSGSSRAGCVISLTHDWVVDAWIDIDPETDPAALALLAGELLYRLLGVRDQGEATA